MSRYEVQTPFGYTVIEADVCRPMPYRTGTVVFEQITKKGWLFDRVEVVATFYGVVSVKRVD